MVLQVRAISVALRDFDAMVIVPMYQSCIVIIGVSWGWLYYNEDKGLSATQRGLFVLGCLLSLCGIMALSLRPDSQQQQQQLAGDEAVPLLQPPLPVEGGGGSVVVLAADADALAAAAGAAAAGTAAASRKAAGRSDSLVHFSDALDELAPPIARFVTGSGGGGSTER
jgi:hypothetical protein